MSGSLSRPASDDVINVMVVDDAPIVRKFYLKMLENNPHIEVVAIAENGLDALIKQRRYDVDVVVLDIEMPVMNGLEALTKLLYHDPELMVLISSTLNWENAEITHIALNHGAADYLEKPSAVRRNLSAEEFQDYMNEKIMTLGLKRRQALLRDAKYSDAIEKKREQLGKSYDYSEEAKQEKQVQALNDETTKKVKYMFRDKPLEQDDGQKDDEEYIKKIQQIDKKAPPHRQIDAQLTSQKQDNIPKIEKIAKKPSSLRPSIKTVLKPAIQKNIASQQVIDDKKNTSDKINVSQVSPPKAPPPPPISPPPIKKAEPKTEEVKRNHRIFVSAKQATEAVRSDISLRNLPANFTPKAIALAASTGGPPLVQKLVPELAQLNLPIFLTQHMPNFFTGVLADQIATRNNLDVQEVFEKELTVTDNGIYIAHGGSHLGVKKENNRIVAYEDTDSPPQHCCKPSVEVMVEHMMQVYGKDILMIVLTGMGRDGSIMAENLADKGGVVVVQDQESSLIWGMPGTIATKGVATKVLAPQEILSWCKTLIK
ncbi:MAG: response regulator [Alphaproteobacteria bacterium]|nr:response regulator [Alphaproteobacteria bacterium]